MAERHAKVAEFLGALQAGLAASAAGMEAGRCLDALFRQLDDRAGEEGADGGLRLPACDHLPEALRTARAISAEQTALAEAFEALEPRLVWRRRSGGPHASDNFTDGHANATIVGPGGLEQRTDAWIGVSLLAPHVRYPDHQHEPEEVYLVLSPGQFRQDTGDWFSPGPGGSFYNRPQIQHAMRSGNSPLFAFWCLRPD